MSERPAARITLAREGGKYEVTSVIDGVSQPGAIEVRRWERCEPAGNPDHVIISARDLWLLASLRAAGTREQAAEIACQIAGLGTARGAAPPGGGQAATAGEWPREHKVPAGAREAADAQAAHEDATRIWWAVQSSGNEGGEAAVHDRQ